MTAKQALARLESAGTAQNRKVYARHGVRTEMFGVSFASLKTLAKEIGTDHALARNLWNSGNHDAAILATMIADPRALTGDEANDWVTSLDSYVLADAFAGLAARAPAANALADAWIDSDGEWIASAGWNVIAARALKDLSLSDDQLARYLRRIERDIQSARNRVRHAMNGALIAIGGRSPELREAAIAAANRIGTVVVDHGQTDCRTPDAAEYIRKMAQRAARKSAPPRKRQARTTKS